MEHQSSFYQSLKILLAQYLPIDRDILHVLIGLVLTLTAVFVTQRSISFGPFLWGYAVACLLGATMEVLDRRDDLQSFGVWRWRASAADFGRTILFPFIGLLAALFLVKKPRE